SQIAKNTISPTEPRSSFVMSGLRRVDDQAGNVDVLVEVVILTHQARYAGDSPRVRPSAVAQQSDDLRGLRVDLGVLRQQWFNVRAVLRLLGGTHHGALERGHGLRVLLD